MIPEFIQKMLAKQTATSIGSMITYYSEIKTKAFLKMYRLQRKYENYEKGHAKMNGQLGEIVHWLAEIERQLAESPDPEIETILIRKRTALQLRRQTVAARPYNDPGRLAKLHSEYEFRKKLYEQEQLILDSLLALKSEKGW